MSDDFPQSTVTPGSSPAGAATDDDERSYRAVPEHAPAAPPRHLPVIGGVVAALSGLVGLVLLIRARRKPPTAQERLAESAHALGAAAIGLGGRAARRTAAAAAAAEPVARDAATVAAGTALGAASHAAGTARDAAGITAEGARKIATVAADGAREVVDGVETVQRAWHKFMTRLTVIVFGSAGYVLGARAGRERYDQIVGAARTSWETVRR